MTKTVVHVTTIEEWKSVLNALFEQEYKWFSGGKEYKERLFELGGRYLFLGDRLITWDRYTQDRYIEYAEFMAQQKDDKEVKTYYVTQEQLDLIQELKERKYPLHVLFVESNRYKNIEIGLNSHEEKSLLRYLGGDETIEFKVKDQLYRLWRIDDDGDKVYMVFALGTPKWTIVKDAAFTAPLEEIKKWKTPAWEIEELN